LVYNNIVKLKLYSPSTPSGFLTHTLENTTLASMPTLGGKELEWNGVG